MVYQSDQDTDGIFELYSVAMIGPTGSGIKLNGILVANGDVGNFQISPDGSRVVYVIFRIPDQNSPGQARDLISVSMAGPVNGIVNLSTPMTAGGNVRAFQISRTADGLSISPTKTRMTYGNSI